MDKKRKWLSVIAVLAAVVATGYAATFRGLLMQEKADLMATHVVTLTYADFAETTTNTAEYIEVFDIYAEQGIEGVAMVLVEEFETGDTNYTDSLQISAGLEDDDPDELLTDTQVATESTAIALKYGTGQVVLTADDVVRVRATPNSEYSTSEFTAGELKLYFRIRDAR
jgi:hypothetical protein